MTKSIDIDAILAPISGDNPAGENLRYSPIYDEIKEARREDDDLVQGDWQHEVKKADWNKVIALSVETLTKKTKDLQISVWLSEALIKTEGFSGFTTGLKILAGLLKNHWEHLYPKIEDGDLDFRVAPIESVNDKFWTYIKQISLTDSSVAPEYSWFKWQESRQVGYEKDIRNQYGDIDDNKKKNRNELISEGKLTAEDFDSAVALSSKVFYKTVAKDIATCREGFKELDEISDEKFGSNAPRLAEISSALDDCEIIIKKILKEKEENEPDIEIENESQTNDAKETPLKENKNKAKESLPEKETQTIVAPIAVNRLTDSDFSEKAMWENALVTLKTVGVKKALGQLFAASCSAPSVREKNRYELFMAKLCLKADRPDLAKPIVEKLYALIEELQLERWESPVWIAELIDLLYQCLTTGEPSQDDMNRAKTLLQKLCTTDVTRAMDYKN